MLQYTYIQKKENVVQIKKKKNIYIYIEIMPFAATQ